MQLGWIFISGMVLIFLHSFSVFFAQFSQTDNNYQIFLSSIYFEGIRGHTNYLYGVLEHRFMFHNPLKSRLATHGLMRNGHFSAYIVCSKVADFK